MTVMRNIYSYSDDRCTYVVDGRLLGDEKNIVEIESSLDQSEIMDAIDYM